MFCRYGMPSLDVKGLLMHFGGEWAAVTHCLKKYTCMNDFHVVWNRKLCEKREWRKIRLPRFISPRGSYSGILHYFLATLKALNNWDCFNFIKTFNKTIILLIFYNHTPPWGNSILDQDLVNVAHADLIWIFLILMKMPIILQMWAIRF